MPPELTARENSMTEKARRRVGPRRDVLSGIDTRVPGRESGTTELKIDCNRVIRLHSEVRGAGFRGSFQGAAAAKGANGGT